MTEATRGRAAGSKNYSVDNIQGLLNIVRAKLPIGGNEWDDVASNYNERFNDTRDRKALKRKFFELVNRKKPTGSTQMPTEVREAIAIHQAIRGKVATASVGTGGDFDAYQLAAVMADEDGQSDSEEEDNVVQETNGSPQGLTQTIATTPDSRATLATSAIPRTRNSRPSNGLSGRKQVGGAIQQIAEAISGNHDDHLNKMMSIMMMKMISRMDEQEEARRRRRNKRRKRRRESELYNRDYSDESSSSDDSD